MAGPNDRQDDDGARIKIQLPDARYVKACEKSWTAIALSPKTWKPAFSGMVDGRARRQREHSHSVSHTSRSARHMRRNSGTKLLRIQQDKACKKAEEEEELRPRDEPTDAIWSLNPPFAVEK